jgi:hypothetical protein
MGKFAALKRISQDDGTCGGRLGLEFQKVISYLPFRALQR